MQRLSFPAMTGVSLIAMATALQAQDATISQTPGTVVLDPITLVSDGQESTEATGGVTLTQADLQALKPADVSELFSRDSAVNVAAGTGPAKRIYVLGLEQSNLAVTVDGVPQFKDSWHHGGSSFVDPAFLKRVEVEAGAAGADAGFAAAAGAVRYETLGARELLTDGRTQGGRASLSYGSNGRGVTASLAGYGVYDGFDWFAMVNTAQGDNYDDGDGNEIPGSEASNVTGIVKLGYEFEGHRVELAYEHSEDDADRPVRMNMNLEDAVYPLKLTRDTLSLTYTETAPSAMWDPELSIYLARQEYARTNFLEGRAGGDFSFDATTVGGVAKNRFDVGVGTVTAGLDWAYNDYSIDNFGDTDVPVHELETMQAGAFVQGRFEFANGIRLSTGGRLDAHRFSDWTGDRRSDTGASVNATIAYEFAPGYEVFAGASRTWLGYDLGEYGYLHARDSSTVTADGFEPATAKNYKLGLNASQGNWTGNVTLFDTRLDGLANAYYPTLDNSEEYRSKGFTLSGNYSWGSGRIGASITKADVSYDGDDLAPVGGEATPFGTVATLFIDQDIPQYNLAVGASVELADRLSGDYITDSGFAEAPGYAVVNAYAEWSPAQYQDVVVRLGVENLLDKAYYERSTYGRNLDRDVTPLYAPGRTVTLGVSMDF
ncbi:TonB-dependent receptor [Paracoccus homiensis]|uniref:Hemoglobin/transferrin/lactoferrin receptor protein n=1 Tax=Paracoccus homiensis TaxID=364199 RepID=A0A1I0EMD7_9RHOB|nr:TonB-dependent receptor [Paracoccus homiensis]SET46553.1 hemoglobin/transferrin/lactoferrin receptor protein [Paracoccus homiensis]